MKTDDKSSTSTCLSSYKIDKHQSGDKSEANTAKEQRREALRQQWLQEHPTRNRVDDTSALPNATIDPQHPPQQQQDITKIQEQYQKENIRRLQNAQRHAAASLEVGQSTTAVLRQQGETLDTIEQEQQDAHYEVKRGRRTVRGMASFGGRIKNLFSRRPERPPPIETGTSSLCPVGMTSEAAATTNANSNSNAAGGAIDASTSKKKRKHKSKKQKDEEEEEEQAVAEGQMNNGQQQQQKKKNNTESAAFGLSEKENQMLDILKNDVAQLRQESYNQQYLLQRHIEQLDRIQTQQDGLSNEIVVTNEKISQML